MPEKSVKPPGHSGASSTQAHPESLPAAVAASSANDARQSFEANTARIISSLSGDQVNQLFRSPPPPPPPPGDLTTSGSQITGGGQGRKKVPLSVALQVHGPKPEGEGPDTRGPVTPKTLLAFRGAESAGTSSLSAQVSASQVACNPAQSLTVASGSNQPLSSTTTPNWAAQTAFLASLLGQQCPAAPRPILGPRSLAAAPVGGPPTTPAFRFGVTDLSQRYNAAQPPLGLGYPPSYYSERYPFFQGGQPRPGVTTLADSSAQPLTAHAPTEEGAYQGEGSGPFPSSAAPRSDAVPTPGVGVNASSGGSTPLSAPSDLRLQRLEDAMARLTESLQNHVPGPSRQGDAHPPSSRERDVRPLYEAPRVSAQHIPPPPQELSSAFLAEIADAGVRIPAFSQEARGSGEVFHQPHQNGDTSPATYRNSDVPPELSPQVTERELPRSVTRPLHPARAIQFQDADESEDPLGDSSYDVDLPDPNTQHEGLDSVLRDLRPWCSSTVTSRSVRQNPTSVLGRLMNSGSTSTTHHLVGGENIRNFLDNTFREPTLDQPANEVLGKKGTFVQPLKKRLMSVHSDGSKVIETPPIPAQPTELSATDVLMKSKNIDKQTLESKLTMAINGKALKNHERTVRDTISEFSVAEGLVNALTEATLTPEPDDQGNPSWTFTDVDPLLIRRVTLQLEKVLSNISFLLGSLYANTLLAKRDAFLQHPSFLRPCAPMRESLRRDPPSSRSLFADHSQETRAAIDLANQQSALANQGKFAESLSKFAKMSSQQSAKADSTQSSSANRGRGRGRGSSQGRGANNNNNSGSSNRGRGSNRARGNRKRGNSQPDSSADASADKKARF